jgi:ribosomal protein L16 Arg81 hydroxylase
MKLGRPTVMNQAKPALVDVLSDAAVFGDKWNRSHVIVREAVRPNDFISTTEIRAKLSASLLRWPYFSLLSDGDGPAPATYTSSRRVLGQMSHGFPDAKAIERLMGEGCSLKLNRLSDWHRPTRDLVGQLNAQMPIAAASYAFWTPPTRRGMLPHRDAAHVVAIQLEGVKRWRLYVEDGQIRPSAGLDVDAEKPTHEFELHPGDVLYLPHGWPHDAIALGGASMHLTFTLTPPTLEDFAESLVDTFERGHEDLVHRFHAYDMEERSRKVRESLLGDVHNLEADEWVGLTLDRMRRTVG